MKKAYIWACIWAIIILAPIAIVFGVYAPAPGEPVDIVKIGVILPFSGPDEAVAKDIRNALELLPKRPLVKGTPPSIVFMYEDSKGDDAAAVEAAGRLIAGGAMAMVSGPATSTSEALAQVAKKAKVPFVSLAGPAVSFSCEKEGLLNVGIGEVAALAVYCESYQKAYKAAVPGFYGALAFDIGNVFLRALDRPLDDASAKKSISRSFESREYKGITGDIRFGSKGSRI